MALKLPQLRLTDLLARSRLRVARSQDFCKACRYVPFPRKKAVPKTVALERVLEQLSVYIT
jgi:hypothetical protein